ncbi:GNAT family N-acetyltransferase [Sporocytophaga myxococcoides]|uniref:GNAT family N-acetyltransferase n=1 Tax=Sporocytophaga myxococcoides TaxID=153721 RepID=UPI000417BFB2|nr:GNAT family N-acetyltransferase [Sporocytophaga myxococcoides]
MKEQNNDCIFCNIYKNHLEDILFEDSNSFVIFDKNPFNQGHLLIISKHHLFDVFTSEQTSLELFKLVIKLAQKIKTYDKCTGINIYQNNNPNSPTHINHLHFHLVPTFKSDGFKVKTFSKMNQDQNALEKNIIELLNIKFNIHKEGITLEDFVKTSYMVNENIENIKTYMSRKSKVSMEEVNDWHERYLNKKDLVVLARNNKGEFIGSSHIKRYIQSKSHSGKLSILVDHCHRGMGVGESLYKNIEEICIKNSLFRIEAEPSVNNLSAITFLQKNGFRIEGIQHAKLKIGQDNYQDCFLMAKIICK